MGNGDIDTLTLISQEHIYLHCYVSPLNACMQYTTVISECSMHCMCLHMLMLFLDLALTNYYVPCQQCAGWSPKVNGSWINSTTGIICVVRCHSVRSNSAMTTETTQHHTMPRVCACLVCCKRKGLAITSAYIHCLIGHVYMTCACCANEASN